MPAATPTLQAGPRHPTSHTWRRVRLPMLAWMAAAASATAGEASIDYLCQQPDGSERRMSDTEALNARRSGLTCLPLITGREPRSPMQSSPSSNLDHSEEYDVVNVHVGITEIVAAPFTSAPHAGVSAASLPAPPAPIAESLILAAQRHGLDPSLVAAVMYVESRYQPQARSPKGALGLMQLMPATARQYGVHNEQALLDPHVNIDVGAQHLRSLVDRFGDRLDLVLAAYNAGEGAVARHGHRVPPYAETREYVRKVLSLMEAAGSHL